MQDLYPMLILFAVGWLSICWCFKHCKKICHLLREQGKPCSLFVFYQEGIINYSFQRDVFLLQYS